MFTTLEKVGLVCMSFMSFQIIRTLATVLYNTCIGPGLRHNVNLKQMGAWAVITGATDGVGKAYARALAKRKINVVLISRSMEKLMQVGAEIESDFHVRIRLIEADFNDASAEAYSKIESELTGIEIGVLINNVGVSYPHPEYFLELPSGDKIYEQIIRCNVVSVTNMTRMVLPQMVNRGKGVVVNISSTAALIPSPLLTVYSASKAYIEKFSRDLASEYSKCGVTVQCLMPGYVATKMSKIKQSTWMAPSPERYVRSAIDSIGIQQVTTGYYPHTMLVTVVGFIESISPSFAAWIITQIMENIRRRALARYVG